MGCTYHEMQGFGVSLKVMKESSYLMSSACDIVLRGTTSGPKVLACLFLVTGLFQMGYAKEVGIVESLIFSEERTAFARKLLYSPEDDVTRMGRRKCSMYDISIFQGPAGPLSNGIPAYTVQILNTGISSCSIADIHLRCGWFSSARIINPSVFRRLDYDDCLVNDGEPLGPGKILSFQYANTFCYPLSVSSVAC